MAKNDWLRRDIHTLTICYRLCLSDEAFQAELRRLKVEEPIAFVRNDHSAASTHQFTTPGGSRVAIVCMRPRAKGVNVEQVYALLVHEAVHIWRWHCELIGEDKPSSEFEAYGIQSISQELMLSYRKMTGKGK